MRRWEIEREPWLTYVVLEIQSVDIFWTALGLISRRGQVRTGDARPVDDGVNVGCLGTLSRGRAFGHSGCKVDALNVFYGIYGISGDH